MNKFIFGGFDSHEDCKLYIEKRPAPAIPQRDTTKTHVPGRSGDVIQDNGCFLNVTRTYKVGCSDIDGNFANIKKMLAQIGYQELTDSYDPFFYRFAAVLNETSFEEDLLNVGHANLTFDCEPYKYDISGIIARSVSASSSAMTTLNNPYDYPALPKFYITASAGTLLTIMINSKSYSFKMPTAFTEVNIDSRSESCYSVSHNLNSGYNSDYWPELTPGENNICVLNAKSAKVYPYWRTL